MLILVDAGPPESRGGVERLLYDRIAIITITSTNAMIPNWPAKTAASKKTTAKNTAAKPSGDTA